MTNEQKNMLNSIKDLTDLLQQLFQNDPFDIRYPVEQLSCYQETCYILHQADRTQGCQ